jgi:spore germination protein YaaH
VSARRARRLAASLALAALLAGVMAQTAAARSVHGRAGTARARAGVQAFLLTGAPDSFADLRAHASQVSVVYPTYYECGPSARVAGADVPAVDAFARAHGIALLPRYTCQDGASVHRILSEPALRARTLERLTQLARAPAFAGLCLDLENDGAGDREALSSFVSALAHALHSERRRLTVVVDGVSSEPAAGSSLAFYDDHAIAAAADTLFVLAWGAHWEGSSPGPLAPLSYVRGVARYLDALPERSRVVLGAPMYGLDWGQQGAGAYQYAAITDLEHRVGAHPGRDGASGEMTFTYTSAAGVAHSVWYMDAHAVLEVIAIARASGLGAGLWRLGEEDQSMWSSPLLGMRARTR